MKYVVYLAGALAIVIGLVALIGAALPVAHRATRRARFRAAPETLYGLISGPPNWRPPSRHDDIRYEVVEARPAERYRTRIAGEKLPFGGTWTYDIGRAADGGSDLRITEDGEVYNVIFRFVSRFVMGHNATIEQYFKDLGAKLGEPVRTEE